MDYAHGTGHGVGAALNVRPNNFSILQYKNLEGKVWITPTSV